MDLNVPELEKWPVDTRPGEVETSPVEEKEEQPEAVQQNFLDQLGPVGGVIQGAADLLLRGDTSPEQTQEIVEQGKANPINQGEPEGVDAVAAELGKAVIGAPTNLGAKIAGAAEFQGDVIGGIADELGIIDRSDEDTPWSENYKYAHYDLGLADTNTWWGGLVQEALSFAMGGAAIGAVSKVAGAGKVMQSVNAVGGDFVLDYFSDAGKGNLSNLVQSSPFANPLSEALAHKDEDNQHWRRFKNSLEGAAPSIAVEGMTAWYRGVRKGNAVLEAGGSPEAAQRAALEEAGKEPVGPFADTAKAENQTISGRPPAPERPRKTPEEVNALLDEFERIQAQADIAADQGKNVKALEKRLREITDELPINARLEVGGIYKEIDLGKKAKADFNVSPEFDPEVPLDTPEINARLQEVWGDELATLSPEELNKQKALAGEELGISQSVYDIGWNAEGDVGTSGLLKINKELTKVFEDLDPGSVVRNTPADDAMGVGQSAAQKRKELEVNDVGDPLGAQFENFKEKMDGQYPLTIGEGADAVTFKDVEAHWRGLTPRARASIAGPAEFVSPQNARSRLYERAGFGPILRGGQQYAVVRGTPNGKRWLEPVDDLSKVPEIQQRVRAEAVEGKPPTYDPQDRVVQVEKADVNDSAASFWDETLPGSGKSLVDEVDIEQISTQQGLREFIAGKIPGVDPNEIARRLSLHERDYVQEVLRSLAEFAQTKDTSALESLRFTNTIDVKGVDAGGAVVLDTLVKSVGERMAVLASEIANLSELDAPFKTQARQFLKRAEDLVVIKKEATQFSSKNLENWKEVPPSLKAAVEKDREQIAELFNELRMGLESTDPAEMLAFRKKMSKLAVAISATRGNSRLQMELWEGLARVGMSRLNSVFINSILSSTLSHMRNISGNLIAIGERTSSRAVGGLFTQGSDPKLAFASFDGIFGSIQEAMAVAGKSWNSPYAITTPNQRMVDFVAQDRQVLVNVQKVASSKGEKFAADIALQTFDLTNNPWFNWPGKALQTGDDFTKTLLARMELRYQAAVEAAEFAKNTDLRPNQIPEARAQIYQQLVDAKVAPNGQVLDTELASVLESAAFQRPLEGWVGNLGRAIQDAPGGRLIMPFFGTGHNITRYAAQNSLLAPLSSEWRHVVANGTPDQKAIMRGRMAVGGFLSAAASIAASQGLMTGYGPPPGPDRDNWLKKNEPTSIRVGTKKNGDPIWASYQAVPGMALVWSTVADLTMAAGRLSDGDTAYILGAAPFFVANAITSQPMFQGILNLSELLDPRAWKPDGTFHAAGDFANTLVGNASLRRQLENALAESMNSYRNWAEAAVTKLTGGLSNTVGLTNPVPRIDILTGEPMQTKYANKLNLINPFTVVGKDVSPIAKVLSEVDYPMRYAVPNKVSGVNLTEEEKNFMAQSIYDGGALPKELAKELRSKSFWNEYDSWKEKFQKGEAEPKEQSRWWGRLDRITGRYISSARKELTQGNSDISKRFREEFPDRAAKAGTGSGGNLSTEEQGKLRTIIEFSQLKD